MAVVATRFSFDYGWYPPDDEFLEVDLPFVSLWYAIGGAYVEFVPGEPGEPDKPLLNHLAVLVESADEHIASAGDLGVEIHDIVDASNTYAVFLRGPEHVRIEYVEHKPTFSLT